MGKGLRPKVAHGEDFTLNMMPRNVFMVKVLISQVIHAHSGPSKVVHDLDSFFLGVHGHSFDV